MRTSVLVALLFSAGSLAAQTYSGDMWASVKSKGAGTISLAYVETPAFAYKDNSGKLTGICLDIISDFEKWLQQNKHAKVTTKFVGNGDSFRGMFDKVKASSGGVIGLGNVTITTERKKEVKFSPPFITNFAILITNSAIPTLTKLEDIKITFANLTAYAAKGTTNEKRILELKEKFFPAMKIVTTTTSQEVLEKVVADPNGFAYLDLAFYLEAVEQKKNVKRHPVGDKSAEQFGLIMPSNSDWNIVIDEFFSADGGYVNSVQYKSILRKHLGETGMKLMQAAK
ncbi:substrate-binding periplasmic protein [Pseudochryseolinea flava]|uniref:ABC transporter substrate-binding protein n=1 Tax=Pseudochryseolinea flava TaxID=2059302 RepID=A0A364Y2P0_9BACT|nr:ABC transporter substrate-binding protein [Pseudochryseolinea flava]RAW01026.1 ABC transporter substrate-binding protein [Pseudochryseolinea flava]